MNCKFCNREISNAGGLKVHENSCKKNPNSIKRTRSPLAGMKKGMSSSLKGKKVGRAKHWDEKFTDEVIFNHNSSYSRRCLKSRIIERSLIEYHCSCCGIGPVWNNKPMPLILDHINGINNDNRLENLRFVCSNCDSQLPTYKSKNRSKVEDRGAGH